MKMKILSSLLLLLVSLINFCSADTRSESYSRYTSGIVQQGNAKINFVRYYDKYGFTFIEIQNISNESENYMIAHVQMWGSNELDHTINKVELKSNKGNGFTLEEENVLPKKTLSKKCIDKWYKIKNLEDWINLGKEKQISCFFYLSNGTTYDMRIDEFLKYLEVVKNDPKNLPITYGPCYSVFFPNKTYNEIKDVFIYNLNYRNLKHNPECINDYWRYVLSDDEKAIGFSYGYEPNNVSYVNFFETPSGTWLNLDNWEFLYETGPFPTYNEFQNRDNVTDVIRKIELTYMALEPLASYGFTLKGSYLKDTLIIDSVDSKNNPDLSALNPGDKIISVNNIDTTTCPTYVLNYIMHFNKYHPTLKLTIKTKDEKVFDINIKPLIHDPLKENIDYSSIIQKETYLRFEERNINNYYTYRYAPYEIFDPYGPQDSPISSPRTAHLDELDSVK